MILEYSVVLMLTMSDGSTVQWRDGKWPIVQGIEACRTELAKGVEEMKVQYKDGKKDDFGRQIKASTFLMGCVAKDEAAKDGTSPEDGLPPAGAPQEESQ